MNSGQTKSFYVYRWLIRVDVWQEPTKFHKATIPQFKNKQKLKMKQIWGKILKGKILFHYDILQNIECSTLCHTIGPCCLSILHIIICQWRAFSWKKVSITRWYYVYILCCFDLDQLGFKITLWSIWPQVLHPWCVSSNLQIKIQLTSR